MEANYKMFNQIKISEDVPRLYFHKSGQYMFNDKALDVYGLTSRPHIIIFNYHRKKYVASIEVTQSDKKRVEVVKMEGLLYDFPKSVDRSREPFFSYELIPFMPGRHQFKVYGEEKIVLRTKRLTQEMRKPKETYLRQQKARQSANIKKVCELLDITEARYNELLFDAGYEYVEHKDYLSKFGDKFLQQPTFWTWWKNQYFIVDDILLRKVEIEEREKGTTEGLLQGRTLIGWYQYEHIYNPNIRLDDYVFKSKESNKETVSHEARP